MSETDLYIVLLCVSLCFNVVCNCTWCLYFSKFHVIPQTHSPRVVHTTSACFIRCWLCL